MKFSQDWFTYNIPHLTELVGMLDNPSSVLEIGCFEGRATCWFLQNIIPDGGLIVCVDPFTGSMEHDSMDLSDLYTTFIGNVAEVEKSSQCVSVMKEYSFNALAQLITRKQQFDFIYVDGSHTAADVLIDACMSWPLLKKGGIMVFDDYHWNPGNYNEYQTPKRGVDAFSHAFGDQFKVVHDGYQIGVQKL